MPRLLVALVALVGCGCEAVTHFDLGRVSEASDTLCSDGVDNDGDGLTDCQDWKCLGQASCCNMPVVVLADDFAAPDCAQLSCDAPDATCQPDPGKWHSWGLPLPVECEGALVPHKSEACYDVGVVSVQSLKLHPGLSISAHIEHGPEPGARLTIGLTLSNDAASGVTSCSPVEPPSAVVAVRQTPTQNGYVLGATFDLLDVGSAPPITDDGAHEVAIRINDDHRAHYSVDGVEFAASPADQPFPDNAPPAYLLVAGRGLKPRVADVRVVDGTQCEAPAAWVPESPPVALDAENTLHGWDSVRVYAPAVRDVGGGVQMYFTGCDQAPGGGCSSNLGIGRAGSSDGVSFLRDAVNPRLSPFRRVALELALLRDDVSDDGVVRGYLSTNANAGDQTLFIESITDDDVHLMQEVLPVLHPGAPGSWDDGGVCCASAIQRDGRVLLWYAGHSTTDPTWRIGLATSSDGVSFEKDPSNPVLAGGVGDAFDAHGVTEPEVVYDAARRLYRMWYTAEAFLGVVSIGYAVSTDGKRWSKFPDNPVLPLAATGLSSLGSPAVHSDEGRLRLWVAGQETGRGGGRIYSFVNGGVAPRR